MLWLLLGILLICSGIVSASETALFGLSRRMLLAFANSPKRWRRAVHALMLQPRRVLMTVLITNTAVNVSIFTVSFFAIQPLQQTIGVAAAALGAMVPLCVIIFGEMIPKAVALSSPNRFAPSAAALVSTIQIGLGSVQWFLARWVVNPVIRLLAPSSRTQEPVSTDELKWLVEHSADEGVITSNENEMLQAIVALEDVSVREVMTPRVDIRSISVPCDHAQAINAVSSSWRRRLPVCGRDLDDIRGVLYARDLYLFPDRSVRQLMRRIHFVPEQLNLVQLLNHFREEKIHMAVVVDEFGGTAGIVTSEDVVEWIVGDLPDAETPRPAAPTEQIDDRTYRLSGDLSARVWADRFAVAEIDQHLDTVGGLILAKLGRWPRVGESVRIQNLTLTVERMRRRRIERVLLHHHADLPANGMNPNNGGKAS